MLGTTELISTGLVGMERDNNNDVLWTWSYPSVSTEQRGIIIKKCSFDLESGDVRVNPFSYGQYNDCWYYRTVNDVQNLDTLLKVKQFVLIVWARDFNPEKYEAFSKILSKTYCKTGDPATLLNFYLSVLTLGSCKTEENGTFVVRDYDQKKAFALSCVKDVINTFKLETILIYTALLLKKRIIVYHHKLANLQFFLRSFPAFVWHRQNWNILYPNQDFSDPEISDMKSASYYVAGFSDASIDARTDLYDLYINLAAVEISIAPHAKETFIMSKTHKDIALNMVRLAEDKSLSDDDVIMDIANKTKDLINTLQSFATDKQLTVEILREKNLAPALENFLFNLAVAENIIKL
uniref:UDENN domain-containing protein n=1 Tax=Strigamia maritima TaxID=126957 RepID=T1IIY2_STRMM